VPKLQTSALNPYFFELITSGAMVKGVPAKVWVKLYGESSVLASPISPSLKTKFFIEFS
jgi:hypothetical protein